MFTNSKKCGRIYTEIKKEVVAMRKLKPREQSVFDYISESILENGYAPSVRDIEEALGFRSTSTVHMYINRLEEFGLIKI